MKNCTLLAIQHQKVDTLQWEISRGCNFLKFQKTKYFFSEIFYSQVLDLFTRLMMTHEVQNCDSEYLCKVSRFALLYKKQKSKATSSHAQHINYRPQ